MAFLSACSTQTNEKTDNENSNSVTDSVQTESSSRIEFKSFSNEDVSFENNTAFVNSQLLLTVDERYTYDDVNAQIEQLGGKIVGCIEFTNDYQIEFENADYNKLSDIQKQLSDYFENSSVELHKVILLGGESNEDNIQYSNNGNWWREAVKLTDLEKETHTYQAVDVGIFDTAFDVNNQDLSYAFQNGEAFNNETEKLKEKHGHHGTNVSGFLAAQKNNNYGIDGTANNVNLFAYSYLGSGDKFTYFGSSMEYKYRIATLLSKNAKIINLSLGDDTVTVAAQNGIDKALSDLKYYTDSFTVFLKKYIDAGREFVIVKCAGNDNGYTWIKCDVSSDYQYGIRSFDEDEDKDLSKFTQLDKMTYDAKYDVMGAITDSAVKKRIIIVGSSDRTNNRASHSNSGERVDIYAPGIELTTLLDGDNGAGTSYATPITAGVIALMWGVNPDIRADDIKYLLTSSADVPIENEKYQINTAGGNIIYMNKYLVNAQNAVKRAEAYKTEKIPSANSNEGVLMGITRLFNNGNLSDFKDKCNISIYKSDTDDVPFKTITTDEYGEFFISLSSGYYTLEAESADGIYRSDRLGFNIESSTVEYMDYLLISKNKANTAEDLINKPVKEIVELMDNIFEISDAGVDTLYYFYNYDKFPGMNFHVTYSGKDADKLKSVIQNGYIDLEAIEVHDSGSGCTHDGKIITADMDFCQVSEIYGKIDCEPSSGAYVSGALSAIAYKEEHENSTVTINFEIDTDTAKKMYEAAENNRKVPYSDVISKNPKIRNIVVRKDYYDKKYTIQSDKIQKYNDKIYYTSEFGHQGLSGKIDMSSVGNDYVALPKFDDKQIDSFVIYNDKIYFTDEEGGTSGVTHSKLYSCNLDGSDIETISNDTDRCFKLEANTIKFSTNGNKQVYRYNLSDKSVKVADGESPYFTRSRIFNWDSRWGEEQCDQYLDGEYYKVFDDTQFPDVVQYYRRDIKTGETVKIGTGFTPQA